MNIKRQYILPNCNLILEGLKDSDSENVDILNGQSPMSILINAECNFLNSNQSISGGSVFLQNLSQAISLYAQGFLSGLSQPKSGSMEYPQVTVEQIDSYLHRVTIDPEPPSQSEGDLNETKTEVKLTTVELFDLVDAIDQFYADRSTLPSMTLDLHPVSKRYRKPEQSLPERLTPVALGFTSLAIAAGAFLIIPPPEVRPPESNPINEETTETESSTPESTPPTPEANSEPNPEPNPE